MNDEENIAVMKMDEKKGDIMEKTKVFKTVILITGILTSLLGVFTIMVPLKTFLSIGWILGVLFLMNGVELVAISLSKEKKEIGKCILGVLEGIAGIILLFSGFQRFLTDVTAAYLVGISILIYGIYQIVNGSHLFKESKSKSILGIVCGVISVLIGIISILHPVLTMMSVGYLIAFSILMQGINMIILAVNMGKEEQ